MMQHTSALFRRILLQDVGRLPGGQGVAGADHISEVTPRVVVLPTSLPASGIVPVVGPGSNLGVITTMPTARQGGGWGVCVNEAARKVFKQVPELLLLM